MAPVEDTSAIAARNERLADFLDLEVGNVDNVVLLSEVVLLADEDTLCRANGKSMSKKMKPDN